MWFAFTIATTLIWGLAELFYKRGAKEEEKYAHLKISVCVGFVMGLHSVFILLTQGEGFDFKNILIYLPVSFCYILSMTLSYFGMRFIEESISDPIENTSGAICSLLCVIFLKAEISLASCFAILLMLFGILGIGYLEHRDEAHRRKKLGKTLAVVAFTMPFCYAILDALGSFLDVYYLDISTSPMVNVTEESIETAALIAYELTFAVFGLALLIFMKIKKVRFELPKQKDKVIASICETAGQFTYVYAMSGNGAIAAPIISSVCVVSLLLSRIFLKEKLTKKQYFFIAPVILGILLLAVIEGD